MKAHEETWVRAGTVVVIGAGPITLLGADFDIEKGEPVDAAIARAKLAAAAPAMARLLLKMSKYGVCPACCRGGNEHWPKCTIVEALRASGVLDAEGGDAK